jgi:hypothetical protein
VPLKHVIRSQLQERVLFKNMRESLVNKVDQEAHGTHEENEDEIAPRLRQIALSARVLLLPFHSLPLMSMSDLFEELWFHHILPETSLREIAALTFVSKDTRALCNTFLVHHLTLSRLQALVTRLPKDQRDCAEKMLQRRDDKDVVSPAPTFCYGHGCGVFELREGRDHWDSIQRAYLPLLVWNFDLGWRFNVQRHGLDLRGLFVFPSLDAAMRVAVAKIKLEEATNAYLKSEEEEEGREPVLKKRRMV